MTRAAVMTRGTVIVIAGPDGAGKSTLAQALAEAFPEGSVQRVHHRFRVLPGTAASLVPTTKPHAQRPYPRWLTRVKVGYLFLDHVLGWWLRVRPFVRRGGVVIIERGWWDLVVDPRRYRLDPGVSLARRLAGRLPAVDRLLILQAPAQEILRRSAELEVPELERQMTLWRSIARDQPRAILIDASRPPADVSREAIAEALSAIGAGIAPPSDRAVIRSRSVRWVDLPPGMPKRWTVPAGPPRLARAALRVHQPITFRAMLQWHAARMLARLGLFALLPRAEEPELQGQLAAYIPTGGCVAVAHLRRPGRAIALIMDAEGNPHSVAKVARDERGREKLAREAEGLSRIGSAVEPPLYAPALIAHEDGVMVFEAVDWSPRWRTWELPLGLAAAVGRFHASRRSGDHGSRGLGHGDFAPWNILRTRDGWVLVDWEDADESAPPFGDPLHYLVQAHALLGRPTQGALVEGVHGRGQVGRILGAYADAAGLSMADAPSAFVAYLQSSLERAPDAPAGDPGTLARQRLLADFGRP